MTGCCLLGATATVTTAQAIPPVASEMVASREAQAETLYREGLVQYEKGYWEAAIELYTNALMLNPHSAQTYSARGGAYGRIKNYGAAIADYTTAIDLDETLASAYGGRGLARTLEGDLDEGVNDLWTAAQLFRTQNRMEQYYRTLEIIEGVAP
jgi:tetratricopeptide (TPR) repeat protein